MKDYSKRDYSTFEETEIRWIRSDGKEFIGLIVGIDYNVGITIVNKEDKEHYLTCLNGPSSPNKGQYLEKSYKSAFFSAIGMIRKKKFYGHRNNMIEKIIRDGGRGPIMGGMFLCPFGA